MVSSYLLDAGRLTMIFSLTSLVLSNSAIAIPHEVNTPNLDISPRVAPTGLEGPVLQERNTLMKRDFTETYGECEIRLDAYSAFGTESTGKQDNDGKYMWHDQPGWGKWHFHNWYKDKNYKETFYFYTYDPDKLHPDDLGGGRWVNQTAHKKLKCTVEMEPRKAEDTLITIHIHGVGTDSTFGMWNDTVKLDCDHQLKEIP